tara:strand:- start:366 stop:587 length:222 start_codon:yes stop_codon:yes gene_type:complete
MVIKNSSDLKTIKIHPITHAKLEDLGGKGETFDKIINRLLIQNHSLKDALNNLSKKDKERIEKDMEANYEKWL